MEAREFMRAADLAMMFSIVTATKADVPINADVADDRQPLLDASLSRRLTSRIVERVA
jgi:hypothetical protein